MTHYAEDINYWKTSRVSPDTWLDKAKREINQVGGQVVGSGSFSNDLTGHAGYMLAFKLEGENFKILWPVIESKSGNIKAARIQAATALYHEVKSACVKLKFLGGRAAFFAYLMLPDGRTTTQVSSPKLIEMLPHLLLRE